jgi:hypothetical protein
MSYAFRELARGKPSMQTTTCYKCATDEIPENRVLDPPHNTHSNLGNFESWSEIHHLLKLLDRSGVGDPVIIYFSWQLVRGSIFAMTVSHRRLSPADHGGNSITGTQNEKCNLELEK